MSADKFAALRKGLLEFLVLSALSSGKMYAADMIRRLEEVDFPTKEGTLYPLLSRLRREGLVEYEWRESALGPPRKYYDLSEAGRERVAEFREHWKRLTTIIEGLEASRCEK